MQRTSQSFCQWWTVLLHMDRRNCNKAMAPGIGCQQSKIPRRVLFQSAGLNYRSRAAFVASCARMVLEETATPVGDSKVPRMQDRQCLPVPPCCGESYKFRPAPMRHSPIRNFRVGFAKTTQLLASELLSDLKQEDPEARLVSLQTVDKTRLRAALDLEGRHHEDVREGLLISEIVSSAQRMLSQDEVRTRPAAIKLKSGNLPPLIRFPNAERIGELGKGSSGSWRPSMLTMTQSD